MLRRTLLTAAAASACPGATRPPNVVLILADDLGSADLSSYGAPDIRTPNIDSIGASGVRFTRFYANAPECTPTRSALMTGCYQQRFGGLECAIGLGDVGRYDDAVWLQQRGELGLPPRAATLPRLFKDHGYDTACFGKWHLGYPDRFSPARHGFDQHYGILGGGADYYTHLEPDREKPPRSYLRRNGRPVETPGYLTDLFAAEAVSWLKQRSARPFFLYLPFNAPHNPIQDPDVPGAPHREGHRPTYARMVERLDLRIGDVLRQIDAMGAAPGTIVIFASDNGADANGSNAPLRGRKSSLWEGGIRVPCMIRWPGVLRPGTSVQQVALTMDLLPTLLSAAGFRLPAGARFDGIDLWPLIAGRAPLRARTVFWRYRRADNVRKAVREGDLKYVSDNGREELHDLAAGELEQRDLLAARPADARRLKNLLADWEADVVPPPGRRPA